MYECVPKAELLTEEINLDTVRTMKKKLLGKLDTMLELRILRHIHNCHVCLKNKVVSMLRLSKSKSFSNLNPRTDMIDKLNSLVTAGVIPVAVALSMWTEMLSGLLDLDMSMLEIGLKTFSSAHNSSSGQLLTPGVW